MSQRSTPLPDETPSQVDQSTPCQGIFVDCKTPRKTRRQKKTPILLSRPADGVPLLPRPTVVAPPPRPPVPRKRKARPVLLALVAGVMLAAGCLSIFVFGASADAENGANNIVSLVQNSARPIVTASPKPKAAKPPKEIATQKPKSTAPKSTTAKLIRVKKLPIAVDNPAQIFVNTEAKSNPNVVETKPIGFAVPESEAPKPPSSVARNPDVLPALPVATRTKTENYGTCLEFCATPQSAKEEAKQQRKLLFILHVSGNFEDDKFT